MRISFAWKHDSSMLFEKFSKSFHLFLLLGFSCIDTMNHFSLTLITDPNPFAWLAELHHKPINKNKWKACWKYVFEILCLFLNTWANLFFPIVFFSRSNYQYRKTLSESIVSPQNDSGPTPDTKDSLSIFMYWHLIEVPILFLSGRIFFCFYLLYHDCNGNYAWYNLGCLKFPRNHVRQIYFFFVLYNRQNPSRLVGLFTKLSYIRINR